MQICRRAALLSGSFFLAVLLPFLAAAVSVSFKKNAQPLLSSDGAKVCSKNLKPSIPRLRITFYWYNSASLGSRMAGWRGD